jgi:OOP family OmpA-OmpF porin
MNQTIPDIKVKGGLRKLGGMSNPFAKKTALIYGMADYTKAGLEGTLKSVCSPKGETPLASAIQAAGTDLKGSRGDIAVIIVSDGKETKAEPITAAKRLKDQYGDQLCIFTVLVGNDPAGQKNMEQVARAGRCGFLVNEENTRSSAAMADFVESVFFAKGLDSDGDGVVDRFDQCPHTPRGIKVDASGCALDSDGDGVADYLDECPNTPLGTYVDSRGCLQLVKAPLLDSDGDGVLDNVDRCPGTPKGATVDARGCWVIKGIEFDTDKSDIKAVYYPILNEVVEILNRNPSLRVEIQGHTDSTGSAKYNQGLSGRRAKAVMEYFTRKGISKDRLTAVGYGLTRPAASNLTREGRAQNRRVELRPIQ